MVVLLDKWEYSVKLPSSKNMSETSNIQVRAVNWRYRLADDTYEPIDLPVIPYIKPRSLNWRYQVAGETYEAIDLPVIPYIKPRALNWRYQVTSDHLTDLN
jgi:hypothetical protein